MYAVMALVPSVHQSTAAGRRQLRNANFSRRGVWKWRTSASSSAEGEIAKRPAQQLSGLRGIAMRVAVNFREMGWRYMLLLRRWKHLAGSIRVIC